MTGHLSHGQGDCNIRRRRIRWYEFTAEKAFWFFVIFVAIVFAIGGGSRYDILSVGPLRFIAALFLAVAIWFQPLKAWRRVRVPMAGLLLLAAWMAFQLVPLPPELWQALPGREVIAALDATIGMGEVWRPITLSPLRTANSLASLIVPLATLAMLSLLDDWARLPAVLVGAAVVSALFGIAQIIFSGADGLYLYAITNRDSAVGLFSNRNHNAVMLTIGLICCALRAQRLTLQNFKLSHLILGGAALVLLAGLLINASRIGMLGLATVGVVYAGLSLLATRESGATRRRLGALVVPALVGLLALGTVAVFALAGRSPAIERVLSDDASVDQRLSALPHVWQLAWDSQPLGVGFGAFEYAFRSVEPVELLQPRYFNQAHNDWLQLPIEGGVPAILIVLLALSAIIARVVRLARSPSAASSSGANPWLGALILMLLALASVFDYPLRTPSLMMVGAIALAMVFKPIPRQIDVSSIAEEAN